MQPKDKPLHAETVFQSSTSLLLLNLVGCVFWHPWGPSSAVQAVVCLSKLPWAALYTHGSLRCLSSNQSAAHLALGQSETRAGVWPAGDRWDAWPPRGPAPTREVGLSRSLRRDAVPGVLTSPLGPAPLIPKTTTERRPNNSKQQQQQQQQSKSKSKSKRPVH